MKNLLAIDLAPAGGFKGIGPLGSGENAIVTFSGFISSAIGLMTIIAFIWFVFTFFIGAIGIISAGGDKQALENSRKKIVNGIIGLVVTISAIFVIRLAGALLGIPDILNLSGLFELIQMPSP
ncbi:MAG: hypothetical protein UX13_C0016G0016 [Candidatus Woesebacteria bacterium GW2011_GWB1_45_5]|uniref:Integral membrane protein n=1 Tax=Candidatus Woesebacteria bacterium GW2011_GWB1_45_5 TaxID=1618581 RepID=A0A0G1MQ05_9BACT|nr:MAG: hypothetical protein UX13_C0016G0016 [Candidatus Woesebacteria bacterium GW2011_GWB1_45_5]